MNSYLSKILNNKILFYVFSRYFSYFIQFLNSIIIAYKLGPYYLGIWGFLLLMMQYMNYFNFGIDYALNVILSSGDVKDKERQSAIASNALIATIATSLIFIILGSILAYTEVNFFEKYNFSNYIFLIISISCLNIFNLLFVNLFRTFSVFMPISVFQLLIQLVQLPLIFFLDKSELIKSLLIALLLAHTLSAIFFILKFPVKLSLRIQFDLLLDLYKRGIILLFYNISFYLLLLSTRTMVSYFYTVETMGLFTFSSNIASALILSIGSIEFVIFPKMLNRLGPSIDNESAKIFIQEIRKVYIGSVYLVILLGLLLYPILLLFFERYNGTIAFFSYLGLTQIIIASGFGYSTLIISRGKEIFMAIHASIAILINLFLLFIGIRFFGLDYSYSSLFLLISFLYYEFQVIRKARHILNMEKTILSVAKDIFPLKLLIPFTLIIIGTVTEYFYCFYALSVIAFSILNFDTFKLLIRYTSTIINRPSVINIQHD